MANHKRKRPKHQRAGCLQCKPHKDERGPGEQKPSVRRRMPERSAPALFGGTWDPDDPSWQDLEFEDRIEYG